MMSLREYRNKAAHLAEKHGDVKYDMFTFGTMGRIEATKRGAWVEAKPVGSRAAILAKKGDDAKAIIVG